MVCLSVLLFLLGWNLPGRAQNLYISDPNFRAFLQSSYGSCMTGDSLDTTCTALLTPTQLYVDGLNISNLTGVKYFSNVTYLYCNHNQLSALPQLPPGLILLNCDGNPLTTLSNLPNGLLQLDCDSTLLTSLPTLPNSLLFLDCNENQLSALPSSLPPNLISLKCYGNNLTNLPALPASLQQLWCLDNQLTSLPALPASLVQLVCDHNQLNFLPTLPAGLQEISCWYNNLSQLPTLPSSLQKLFCNYNPISCLPLLPASLQQLQACQGTNISCLPNIPPGLTFNDCSAMPQCQPGDPCAQYSYIRGKVYIDYNNNCVQDVNDLPLPNRIILINNQAYASTDSNGNYLAFVDTGSFITDTYLPGPLWEITCPGIPYTAQFTTFSDSLTGADFPNHPTAICPWLTVDVAHSNPRACRRSYTSLMYANMGTDTAHNAYVEVTFDPELIPLSSAPPWSSVSGQTYTFQVGTLAPGQSGYIYITDSVSCTALIGQSACVSATIFPNNVCTFPGPNWDQSSIRVKGICQGDSIRFGIYNEGSGNMGGNSNYSIYEDNVLLLNGAGFQLNSGDSLIIMIPTTGKTYRLDALQRPGHPGNSYPRVTIEICGSPVYSLGYVNAVAQDDMDPFVETDCWPVTNSYDPNHKYSQPDGLTVNRYILASDELEYQIAFQNTGNDTAYQVVLVDTLDTQVLDAATVVPGAASHPYTFAMIGPGILQFTFANINLLDSANHEPQSHGFVKFKIRQQPNNPPGTVINNSVGIYFDFNPPVITNTIFNTIQTWDYLFSTTYIDPAIQLQVTAYPNPFAGQINFRLESDQVLEDLQLVITDLAGRTVLTRSDQGMLIQVDASALAPGMYSYTILRGQEKLCTGRIIAQ